MSLYVWACFQPFRQSANVSWIIIQSVIKACPALQQPWLDSNRPVTHRRLQQQTDERWDRRISHHLQTQSTDQRLQSKSRLPFIHYLVCWRRRILQIPPSTLEFTLYFYLNFEKTGDTQKPKNERTDCVPCWVDDVCYSTEDQRPCCWLLLSHVLIPKFLPIQLFNQ